MQRSTATRYELIVVTIDLELLAAISSLPTPYFAGEELAAAGALSVLR